MNTRHFVKLDIRPLLQEGKEPFEIIMAQVSALAPGEGLELTAPFMPAPLVEFLGGQGYATDMERGDDGSWIVWFWKESS